MEISKNSNADNTEVVISLTEYEYPEGGDCGGYADVEHKFTLQNGKVTHDYGVKVDEPEDCDCEPFCQLPTKQDALKFVAATKQSLLDALAIYNELEALLIWHEYVDAAEEGDEE